jgi:hypothetical protein
MRPRCARRNVRQDVGRSGAGRMPFAFSAFAIVLPATRCPRRFSSPWMREVEFSVAVPTISSRITFITAGRPRPLRSLSPPPSRSLPRRTA